MSLTLEKNEAELTVFGFGWDDAAIDSGEAETEEGETLEDYVYDIDYDPTSDPDFDPYDIPGYDPDNPDYDPDDGLGYDLTYDFGENFNWDAVAEDIDINLDLDGNIDVDQLTTLSENIAKLAHDEDAIYNYMTDHSPSSGIPARIRVINPPDKLEYKNGDEIDFTGLIAAAYASLSTRLPFIMEGASGPHQNQIPFDQLTFPETKAESGHEESTFYAYYGNSTINDMYFNYVTFPLKCFTCLVKSTGYHSIQTENAIATILARATESRLGALIVASSSSGASFKNIYSGPDYSYTDTYGLNKTYTYDGETVYYYYSSKWTTMEPDNLYEWYTDVKILPWTESEAKKIAWLMVYGDMQPADADPVTISVPVQWQTEYREEPYEASFDIQVT